MNGHPLQRVFRIVGLLVCLASTALSVYLGGMAAFLYHGFGRDAPPETGPHDVDERMWLIGMIVGGVGGLGAGLLWTYAMRQQALRTLSTTNRVSPWLIGIGTMAGIGVGLLATILLHVALGLVSYHTGADDVIANLLGAVAWFTFPAGGFLGLVSGIVWYGACSDAHCRSQVVREPRS